MKLLNIAAIGRIIYLFLRDDNNKQVIQKDDTFYPYYFEKVDSKTQGDYTTIEGYPAKIFFCSDPKQVYDQSSNNSYEADVRYVLRYLIDKVENIEKTNYKYGHLDIEVKADKFPKPSDSAFPISSVSIWNSETQAVKNFWLPAWGGLKKEKEMILDVIAYLKQEKFDIISIWNIKFDFPYLYNRCKKLFGTKFNFAEAISPIDAAGRAEWGKLITAQDYQDTAEVYFPKGISCLDMMQLFQKFTRGQRQSYALDNIAQVDLGEESWGEENFGDMSETIRDKNISDCVRMEKINQKFQLLEYFNALRCMTKVEFTDVYHNSRIIDMLMLQEARKRGVVLQTKAEHDKELYEGAYRECFEKGRHFGITKTDLNGAYPQVIADFCLDKINLRQTKEENCIEVQIKNLKRDTNDNIIYDEQKNPQTENGNLYYFKQDSNAIFPAVVKKLLIKKAELKDKLKTLTGQEKEDLKVTYEAHKGLVNSLYGSVGMPYFRLYSTALAETTTFLVRDVLIYCMKRLKEEFKVNVIYSDTDALMYNSKIDYTSNLNSYIQDWAKTYGKSNIDLKFECEGYFEKLLLIAKCRYQGMLNNGKEIITETKGLEARRGDSSIYVKYFSDALISKVLNQEETKESIIAWIKSETVRFKTLPVEEIAFPCKKSKTIGEYSNLPIHVRALEQTKEISKQSGQLYFWLYCKPRIIGTKPQFVYTLNGKKISELTVEKLYKDNAKGLPIIYRKKEYTLEEFKLAIVKDTIFVDNTTNVIAFDKLRLEHLKLVEVDYDKMIERNIYNKVEVIFESLGWELKDLTI